MRNQRSNRIRRRTKRRNGINQCRRCPTTAFSLSQMAHGSDGGPRRRPDGLADVTAGQGRGREPVPRKKVSPTSRQGNMSANAVVADYLTRLASLTQEEARLRHILQTQSSESSDADVSHLQKQIKEIHERENVRPIYLCFYQAGLVYVVLFKSLMEFCFSCVSAARQRIT
jgi:hypothetical protein